MNCTRARDLLQLYLDGALDPPEAQELESHVAGCAGCRGELVQLERLMLSVESLPRLSAPPELLPRTMAALTRQPAWGPGGRLFRWATNAGGIAAMVAGLLLAVFSADDAFAALAGLMLEQENPVTLLDGLLGVAASMEMPLVAGLGLLLVAGCLTLVQLVTPSEATAS